MALVASVLARWSLPLACNPRNSPSTLDSALSITAGASMPVTRSVESTPQSIGAARQHAVEHDGIIGFCGGLRQTVKAFAGGVRREAVVVRRGHFRHWLATVFHNQHAGHGSHLKNCREVVAHRKMDTSRRDVVSDIELAKPASPQGKFIFRINEERRRLLSTDNDSRTARYLMCGLSESETTPRMARPTSRWPACRFFPVIPKRP
jgi:hypothetical protein